MRLDGDAALTLEVHRVEDLRLHLARLKRAGELEEAIRQGRLAMVDVRDDREIADVALIHRGVGTDELYLPSVELPNFRHLTPESVTGTHPQPRGCTDVTRI